MMMHKMCKVMMPILLIFMFGFRVMGDDVIVPDTDQEIYRNDNTPLIEEKSLTYSRKQGPLSLEMLPIETEKEDPYNSVLMINKTLISGVWHVGCDVMGNQKWVKDEISNPKGIPSREGHRLAYCGDPSHWIIYLDEYGVPFMMDEIKSGATGGTLNTKFFTDGTYTEEKSISEIKCGERIYWITWHNDQVWHHTGITTPEIPEFSFLVNDVEYAIEAGSTLTLDNLPAGTYQIIEKYNPEYFVADVSIPFVVDEDCNVIANVTIGMDDEAVVNFTNQRITPDKPEPETDPIVPDTEPQTEIITESESETETETESETETEKVTETETESESETESETETETEFITESETDTEIITEVITESESETQTETEQLTEKHTETELVAEKPTEKPTEKVTEKSIEMPSEKPTEKQTEAITEKKTEKVTEKPTEKQTQKPAENPTEKPAEKPTEKPTENVTEKQPEKLIVELPNETNPTTETEQQAKKPGGVLGAHDPRSKETEKQDDKVAGSNRKKESDKTQKKKKNRTERQTEKTSEQQIIRQPAKYVIPIPPKTGDESPIIRLVTMLILSFTSVVIMIYLVYRNNKH